MIEKNIILIFIFVLVMVILFYTYSVGHIFFFDHALWDLSYLTRDRTPAPSSQSTES